MSSSDSSPSINDEVALQEPARKKLKSCEPDLKITVGGDVDGSGAVDYWYHASIMATHSNYIDTMLASGMKESNTYDASFPDIAPATWESMMKFLDDPLAGRLMTVTDVMEVTPWYDQYDFPAGRKLSGHILMEYIQATEAPDVPDNFDFFIDAIVLADALHLDAAKKAGLCWIDRAIIDGYNQEIFSRDHIAKLAPLIAKEELLFENVKSLVKSVVTNDILHRLFPELLVEKFASNQMGEMILDWVGAITLSGSGCDADGLYCSYGSGFCNYNSGLWGDEEVRFEISMRDDIWVIIGRSTRISETILWKCTHSRTRLMIPPKDGWVPVDELARDKNPTLKCRRHPEE